MLKLLLGFNSQAQVLKKGEGPMPENYKILKED